MTELEIATQAYCQEHNDDCFEAIGDECPYIGKAFKAGANWQYEQFEKESELADIEEFSYTNGIDTSVVSDLMAEYRFNGSLTDDGIRKKLMPYHLGLLKTTKLTAALKQFIKETHEKYMAEGD